MAGESLAASKQRAKSVSPVEAKGSQDLMPTNAQGKAREDDAMSAGGDNFEVPPQHGTTNDNVEEKKEVDTDTRPNWEKMQDKVEDLIGRAARHFEDNNDRRGDGPPIVTAPNDLRLKNGRNTK